MGVVRKSLIRQGLPPYSSEVTKTHQLGLYSAPKRIAVNTGSGAQSAFIHTVNDFTTRERMLHTEQDFENLPVLREQAALVNTHHFKRLIHIDLGNLFRFLTACQCLGFTIDQKSLPR